MTLPLRSLLALACSLPAFASHPLPRSSPATHDLKVNPAHIPNTIQLPGSAPKAK
jgi:hypothetical protein